MGLVDYEVVRSVGVAETDYVVLHELEREAAHALAEKYALLQYRQRICPYIASSCGYAVEAREGAVRHGRGGDVAEERAVLRDELQAVGRDGKVKRAVVAEVDVHYTLDKHDVDVGVLRVVVYQQVGAVGAVSRVLQALVRNRGKGLSALVRGRYRVARAVCGDAELPALYLSAFQRVYRRFGFVCARIGDALDDVGGEVVTCGKVECYRQHRKCCRCRKYGSQRYQALDDEVREQTYELCGDNVEGGCCVGHYACCEYRCRKRSRSYARSHFFSRKYGVYRYRENEYEELARVVGVVEGQHRFAEVVADSERLRRCTVLRGSYQVLHKRQLHKRRYRVLKYREQSRYCREREERTTEKRRHPRTADVVDAEKEYHAVGEYGEKPLVFGAEPEQYHFLVLR